MELDASKKKADIEGITTRGDGVRYSQVHFLVKSVSFARFLKQYWRRTPAMEIILDELTYDGYLLSNFLQVRY